MKHFSLEAAKEISLSEDSPKVQVARVGSFKHPQYGNFKITKKTLEEFKKNFDSRVRGQDIAFDYFHENEKVAAGWPKKLELRDGGSTLWATDVDWTPRGLKSLQDKEIRYFSPEFVFEWENPETGQKHSNVLFGGGLTNRPFIKDMEPIISLSEIVEPLAKNSIGENEMDKDKLIEELKAEIAALKEKLAEKKLSEDDLAEKNKKLSEQNEILLSEKKIAEEAKILAEKENSFNVLLSEGKACVAQKEAFLKGDMAEFVKNQQPLNLSEQGSGKTPAKPKDVNVEIMSLAEEKMKENKKLDLGSAISLALSEKPELEKAYREQK